MAGGNQAVFQEFLQRLFSEQQKEIARRLKQAGIFGATIDASNISGNFTTSRVSMPQAASQVLEAVEGIAAGQVVSISASGVRLADSSLRYPADGFATAAITLGDNGLIHGVGIITGLTGLTTGATQYLSTAGQITETVPTATGAMFQIVGVALSATRVLFQPQPPIIL